MQRLATCCFIVATASIVTAAKAQSPAGAISLEAIAEVCRGIDRKVMTGGRGRVDEKNGYVFDLKEDKQISITREGVNIETTNYTDYSKCLLSLSIALRPPRIECKRTSKNSGDTTNGNARASIELAEKVAGFSIVAKWCEVHAVIAEDRNGYRLYPSDIDENTFQCQLITPPARSVTAHLVMCRVAY